MTEANLVLKVIMDNIKIL